MEKLTISEQHIINAVCVYVSRKKQVAPQDVEVELMYNDDTGFSAEAYVLGQVELLNTAHLMESLRMSIGEFLDIDPISAGIKLLLHEEEGIIAEVH